MEGGKKGAWELITLNGESEEEEEEEQDTLELELALERKKVRFCSYLYQDRMTDIKMLRKKDGL